MKILTKYIYKESIKSFATGMVIFTFVLVLNNLFQLIDLLINKNAGIFTVLKLILYLVMTLFSVTIPMSMLFAVLLTYGRLSEDREIIALSSSGINTFRFTFQPILLALALSLMLSWLNLDIIPKVQSEFSRIYFTIAKKQPLLKFEEKAFTKIGNYRIYINEINKKTNDIKGINIYKVRPEYTQIVSKSGTVNVTEKNITFDLKDGIMQTSSADKPENFTHFAFNKYAITISVIEEQKREALVQTLRELTGRELLQEIKRYSGYKMPTAQLEIEYQLRWVIGFAALCLVLVGLPMGILMHRGGQTIGFGISIGIICFYYFFLIGCISMAERIPKLPVTYVVWFPNMFTFTIGMLMMRKLLKK